MGFFAEFNSWLNALLAGPAQIAPKRRAFALPSLW